MFNQNCSDIRQHYNRINSLAALAGKITQSHFALLKSCAQIISRYAECYVLKGIWSVSFSKQKANR